MNEPEQETIDPPADEFPPMGRWGILAFGMYFVILSLLILYVLIVIWPTKAAGTEPVPAVVLFGCRVLNISDEARLLLIVVLAGALGSYVHTATSFVTYVGNRQLKKSWIWWYILRPFIGSALAIIVYFALRGGLLSVSAGANDISYFGVAAISGMVGMFSKEATDKLHEIFLTLFKPTKEIPRADKLKSKDDEGQTP